MKKKIIALLSASLHCAITAYPQPMTIGIRAGKPTPNMQRRRDIESSI